MSRSFTCATLILSMLALRAPAQGAGSPVLVNMIPANASSEMDDNGEPFLAQDPILPDTMIASALLPNPFSNDANAPILFSADDGHTWSLKPILPSRIGTLGVTVATTGFANIYGAILRERPKDGAMLRAANGTTATMVIITSRPGIEQPFIQAKSAGFGSPDRVYVASNDLNAPDQRTATIDFSPAFSGSLVTARIETRATAGRDGPAVRVALAGDETVYAAFFGWRSRNGNTVTSDVVMVRDDHGGRLVEPFSDLRDSDGLAGRRVAQGVAVPLPGTLRLGRQEVGSALALAVHPTNSSKVYIAWGELGATPGSYQIHVRRSVDRGATWSFDLRTLVNATNPALAVAVDGTLGLLYQQLEGEGPSARWVTHLEQKSEGSANFRDDILATFPATEPLVPTRVYLGNYVYLAATGDHFRGVFSASNTPDLARFPIGVRYQRRADFASHKLFANDGRPIRESIDPFFFKVPIQPGPVAGAVTDYAYDCDGNLSQVWDANRCPGSPHGPDLAFAGRERCLHLRRSRGLLLQREAHPHRP